MKFGNKKVLSSAVLTTSLIVVIFMTLLVTSSSPSLVVMARRVQPGTFEIDIYGDASGFHSMCEMFQHFSVMKLKWSASVPSYPTGHVDITLDARDLNFDKVNDWTYHLSLKGLEECSIVSTGYMSYIFLVKARSGELDLTFSNPSTNFPYYYRTVDIEGTLRGDVLFNIDVPDIPKFNYEGPELTILVHIGT